LKNLAIFSGFVLHHDDNKVPQITIKHGMAPKWSSYHATTFELMFLSLGIETMLDHTENSIFITLKD